MKGLEDREHEVKNLSRKGYVPIKIEQVRLVLEEAVLGTGCKSDVGNGPDQEPCIVNFVNCLIDGS